MYSLNYSKFPVHPFAGSLYCVSTLGKYSLMLKELLKGGCLLLVCVFLTSGPRVIWIQVARDLDP